MLKKCFLGLYLLLQSPSGWFSIATLIAVTYVTIKQPSVGGMAMAAFVSIIPAALGYFEHKETMAQPPPPQRGIL